MKQSILFIDQFREVTGGQVVLQSLVKVAHEAGFHVGVLAPMGGGVERALRARWGDDVARHDLPELDLQSGRKGWRDALLLLCFSVYLLRFLRLVCRHSVVYVNGGRLTLPFALVSLLTVRPRWIYHLHLCHSGLEKKILSLIARLPRTGGVVLASRYIHQDFVRERPEITRNPRICVVENCLNSPFTDLSFVNHFCRSDTPLTVALIGRVSPVKGHSLLPVLAAALPDMRFVFIGQTELALRPYLRSLLAASPRNLRYEGASANLPELINRLPIHFSIVPSRWDDPFGLVSIESMAASCLTLVSNRGMLPHIAACTGAWCFRDDEELIAMLKQLREMPRAEMREIAARQQASVVREFGFDDFRRKILQVLAPGAAGDTRGGLDALPPALAA